MKQNHTNKNEYNITRRQQQIALLLQHQDKIIGNKLGISANTVKTIIANMKRNMNVSTRTELVLKILKLNLISLNDIEIDTNYYDENDWSLSA